jgi:hypothetical protein
VHSNRRGDSLHGNTSAWTWPVTGRLSGSGRQSFERATTADGRGAGDRETDLGSAKSKRVREIDTSREKSHRDATVRTDRRAFVCEESPPRRAAAASNSGPGAGRVRRAVYCAWSPAETRLLAGLIDCTRVHVLRSSAAQLPAENAAEEGECAAAVEQDEGEASAFAARAVGARRVRG